MTVPVTTNSENMKCFSSLKHILLMAAEKGKRHFLTKTSTSKLKERKGACMTCEGGCEMNSMAHWDLAECQWGAELKVKVFSSDYWHSNARIV